MNRREAIKAGLVCAIAPIIPIETVRAKPKITPLIAERFGRSPGLQVLSDPTKHYIAALKVQWDKAEQKIISSPISSFNFYKKA